MKAATIVMSSMILCLSISILIFWMNGLVINFTPSMPVGIWKVDDGSNLSRLARGQTIVFCPPDAKLFRDAKAKGILKEGRCAGSYTPLLKEVVGVPGDRVRYSNEISINGLRIANSTIQHSPDLPHLKHLPESFTIPAGQVFVMSRYSNQSFDSRYFGEIPSSKVMGSATPIWLW